MKKTFLKPLAMAALAFTVSCAGSSESNNNTTATDQMGGTEMGTNTNTTTDPMGGTGMSTGDAGQMSTEQVSNTDVDYGNILNSVDNTEDYDVLALARMDENFSTFVDLLERSGLNVSLQATDQDVTLFIPTNEAFQNLSEERLQYLTDPQNRAELVSVIQAHIIPTEISTIRFSDNQRIETADGKSVPVSTGAAGTNVTIGGANIVKGDIDASNGTVHVVDAVIQAVEDPVGPGAGY